jgi:hypothetical protein
MRRCCSFLIVRLSFSPAVTEIVVGVQPSSAWLISYLPSARATAGAGDAEHNDSCRGHEQAARLLHDIPP